VCVEHRLPMGRDVLTPEQHPIQVHHLEAARLEQLL
jgi:hypothetical protein